MEINTVINLRELAARGFPITRENVYLACTFANVGEFGIVCNDVSEEREGLDLLAEELCCEIEGFKLDCRFAGSSIVVMIIGDVSLNVTTNFGDKGKPYRQISAKTEGAKRMARVLNMFLRKSATLLQRHPINKRRKIAANAILIKEFFRPTAADVRKLESGRLDVNQK